LSPHGLMGSVWDSRFLAFLAAVAAAKSSE
jgi:hypothetical protein